MWQRAKWGTEGVCVSVDIQCSWSYIHHCGKSEKNDSKRRVFTMFLFKPTGTNSSRVKHCFKTCTKVRPILLLEVSGTQLILVNRGRGFG